MQYGHITALRSAEDQQTQLVTASPFCENQIHVAEVRMVDRVLAP